MTDVDLHGLDPMAVKGTFEAMDKVFNDWPELKGRIREIGQSKNGIMPTRPPSVDGFRIDFYPGIYSDIDRVKEVYNRGLASGAYPLGTDWKNAGVHELEHVAHGRLAQINATDVFGVIYYWDNNISTKKIVSEA